MKKLYLSVLAVVLVLAVFQRNFILKSFDSFYYKSTCDTPIHYKTGFIDKRFNISENEFLADIQQATNLWGVFAQKDLFVPDPKGTLVINLVFDKRQALNNQISQLENTLESKKSQINPEIAQYEKDVEDFKRRSNSLNEEIISWNNKGGAPPEVFNRLTKDQKSLQEDAAKLNATADRLNQTTNLFNVDVGKLNETVSTFNQALAKRPEEGLYDGRQNEIYIYFLTDKNELIHTLAHELGHALSLNHAINTDSIMYPYTTKTIMLSSEDRKALQKLCAKQSLFEIFVKRVEVVIENLRNAKTN